MKNHPHNRPCEPGYNKGSSCLEIFYSDIGEIVHEDSDICIKLNFLKLVVFYDSSVWNFFSRLRAGLLTPTCRCSDCWDNPLNLAGKFLSTQLEMFERFEKWVAALALQHAHVWIAAILLSNTLPYPNRMLPHNDRDDSEKRSSAMASPIKCIKSTVQKLFCALLRYVGPIGTQESTLALRPYCLSKRYRGNGFTEA